MSKEYVVYVIQHGFAIVEANSPEEARKQIEDDSRDLCWSRGIEVTSVENNRDVQSEDN